MRKKTKAQRIEEEHFAFHIPTTYFDFYCVAHLSEYYPKYLEPYGCHSLGSDNLCNESCRMCSRPCPVEGCNNKEFWDEELGIYKNDPKYDEINARTPTA